MIEQAIYNLLSNAAGVTALVSTRIYPPAVPQSATLPWVRYERVNSEHQNHLTAAGGLYQARVQIDSVSRSYSQAKDIAEAVRDALHGYSGTAASVVVRSIMLDQDRDRYEPPIDENDIGTYTIMQDYSTWTVETIPTFA